PTDGRQRATDGGPGRQVDGLSVAAQSLAQDGEVKDLDAHVRQASFTTCFQSYQQEKSSNDNTVGFLRPICGLVSLSPLRPREHAQREANLKSNSRPTDLRSDSQTAHRTNASPPATHPSTQLTLPFQAAA